MKTNKLCGLVAMLPFLSLGCSSVEPSTAAAPEPPATKAHMNVLQLMRAFPFPHSNVLFDTQGKDPEGPDSRWRSAYTVGTTPTPTQGGLPSKTARSL